MQTFANRSASSGSPAKRIGLLAIIATFILFFVAVSGNAQSTSGSILGTVTDQSGAVLPNTTVQLINQATNTKVQAVSNDSGYYQFVSVPPATYKIVVQKEGFKQMSRAGVVLQTQARIQVDLALQVGASTETVEVTASSPLIEADNVSLGTVVDQRETNELPLNGRNPMNLTALVASVIPLGQTSGSPTGVNPFAWGNYQIGGGVAGQSSTYIDGAPDNGIYFHNTEIIPSQDSIQEFKVETNNLSAEYGALAGGAINFTTKSGTKDIHAAAWEYIRNKVLNANDYYSNLAGISRGAFTQNQYGFNVGGPVFIPHVYDGRKKTFFFLNWEGFNLRQGEAYTTSVPTTNELGGDLSGFGAQIYDPMSTCSTDGSTPTPCTGSQVKGDRTLLGSQLTTATGQRNSINPTALAYLKAFMPAPNTTGNAQGLNNFTSKTAGGGNNYQTVARIDHDFSERQHISGRYTYWKNNNLAVDPLGTGICANGNCAENYFVHNFILDDTYTLSPKMILDMRLSYARFDYSRVPLRTNFDVTTIGWPSAYQSLVEFPGPPVMQIPSFDQAGLFNNQGADSTIYDAQDTYRLAGSLTRFVANHTLKVGGEYTAQRFNYAQTNTSSGMWYFNPGWTSSNALTGGGGLDVASYLLGYPGSGGSWYDNKTASASHYPAVYATDDWRASQKLTLHVGIRWEESFPYTERYDRISIFDPSASNDVLTANNISNVPGNVELVNSAARSSRYGVNPDSKQISPRAGASYRLRENTVITLGYGIFWLPMDVTTGQNPGWDGTSSFTTPYVGSANGLTPSNSISTPYPIDPSTGKAYIIMPTGRSTTTVNSSTVYQYQVNTLGNGVSAMFPNDNWGYAQQWNFGVQQQIGKTTALNIAYSGSKGTHIPFSGIQMNQLPDSDLAQAQQGNLNLSALVPNPYYNAIPNGNSLKLQQISTGQTMLRFPEYPAVGANGAHMGDSTYNALEAKLTKRFAHGASLNVAYTFSKLISDTDTLASWLESISGIQDNNNLRGEKSLSSTSTPQRLVIAYVYDLPVGRGKALLPGLSRPADYVIGGWGLQGLTTLMKGFPLGLGDSNNTSNSYGGGQRPNVVAGCNKNIGGPATKKLSEWFNTACFTQAPAYTFGNESRLDPNMKAPGVANWDLSIVKKFALDKDGRMNLQFRSEFYNLFNRVQFGVPNTSVGSPSYGVISGTQNLPRVAQFALRLSY